MPTKADTLPGTDTLGKALGGRVAKVEPEFESQVANSLVSLFLTF